MTTHSVPELRPGQTLNIVCEATKTTPFGQEQCETVVSVTYEEILERFKPAKKATRKNSAISAFSRFVCQVNLAVQTGKWSNGGEINREEIIENLAEKFFNLATETRGDVSDTAMGALGELGASKFLKAPSRKILKDILAEVQTAGTEETEEAS